MLATRLQNSKTKLMKNHAYSHDTKHSPMKRSLIHPSKIGLTYSLVPGNTIANFKTEEELQISIHIFSNNNDNIEKW